MRWGWAQPWRRGNGRPRPARRRRSALWAAGLALPLAVVLAGALMVTPSADRLGDESQGSAGDVVPPSTEEASLPAERGVPGLVIGATHTEDSADPWDAAPAVERAKQVLGMVAPVQNQHIMGWGAGNPEPRPDEYDFRSLDRRIELITDTGAEPMLTLCCAPDWMKGGQAGATDWSRIAKAPTPEHYEDFAELARVVAQRYPQVRRFVIWNELKGFYHRDRNNWHVEAYTELYNRVYAAVKEVRPDALVGGPYITIDSWGSKWAGGHESALRGPWGIVDQRSLDVLDHWLTHADGADFIAMDAGTWTRDAQLVAPDFQSVDKLTTATAWVRARSDLPIWWMEIYAYPDDNSLPLEDARRAVLLIHALVGVAREGAAGALLWSPQATPGRRSSAVFSEASTADGGRPLPVVDLLRVVSRPLRDRPMQVVSSWDPVESRWTLRTPEHTATWTPDTGIRISAR